MHTFKYHSQCSASKLLLGVSLAILLTFCSGQSRAFTSFDSESLTAWTLIPGAQQVNNTVQLTSNTSYSYAYGAAFWKSQQPVDVDFTISFSFQIVGSSGTLDIANNGYGADGISFIISSALPASGGIWGKMGYEWATPTSYKSVIIELDTHYDDKDPVDTIGPDGEQQIIGPDGNHVGINLNGGVESIAAAHVPGLFNDGAVHYAWITYEMSDRSTLKVYYNGIEKVQPILPMLKTTVPLKDILGSGFAFFGFTAGSQSSQATQTILSMEYTQGRAESATATPSPVTPPTFTLNNTTFVEVQMAPKASLHGDATNKSAWTMSPSASVDTNGSLVLTVSNWDAAGKAAAAVNPVPVNATIGFSVQFDVQMAGFVGSPDASNDGTGGNGLALVLLPTAQLPSTITPNGPGYSSMSPSVAVELDTLYDAGIDPVDTVSVITGQRQMMGADGNHIGINRDGKLASLAAAHIPDLMNDGNIKHVWVDYFAHNTTLITYYSAVTLIKPAAPVLAYVLNVSEALGGLHQIYVGFTAACSQSYQNHTIVSANISEAVSMKMLGPGVAGVTPVMHAAKKKKKRNAAAIAIPVLAACLIGGGALYGFFVHVVKRGKCAGDADNYRTPEEGLKSLTDEHSPSAR